MGHSITVFDKTFVPFIGAEAIQEKIKVLAADLTRDYAGAKWLIYF